MKRPIEKTSLPAQVARHIREDISSGVWNDRLPGRRLLAQRYQVSQRTCSAAVALLERDGMLGTAEPGKGPRILPAAIEMHADSRTPVLLILHQSLVPIPHDEELLLRALQEAWEQEGGRVVWQGVDFQYRKSPGSRIETLIARHSADAIVTLCPGGTWPDETSKRLPTFQLGGPPPREHAATLLAFSVSWEVSRVVRHLSERGHRRILATTEYPWMVPSLIEGMRNADETDRAPDSLDRFCQACTTPAPEAWIRFWQENFLHLEPTAVIVDTDWQLLSLYGFCARAGLRIPNRLSVVMMGFNPLLEWLHPKPTMMWFPNDEVVRQFKKWIGRGMESTGNHLVEMTFKHGESVAGAG
ncbi:substrate-binding domain-containing protein [Haloferula sp. A504]|uniref:substrate-binding domain-containing protein n=1 Tax=Haloferula sp. A504 TaxID=3373601 RepID=UPI0031C5CF10|nr:substrate-binding domain-containing protein [Verrucomicrobiaceae bacterium E54]